MGADAHAEMVRWDWEAATSYLRNVQYHNAKSNFLKRGVVSNPAASSNLFFDAERIERERE